MKTFITGLALLLLSSASQAQADALAAEAKEPVPAARIAHFSGDRAAAISYTFDDNLRDQYTLAVPMLNELGFKGTFFVIAGKTAETPEQGAQQQENGNVRNLWGGISWPELKAMAAQGHEIASHTWMHAALTKLTPEDVDAQFGKAYEAIKTHIGTPPLTMAFPGNGSNAEIQQAALKYHVAFRAYQQSTSGKSTTDSLNRWADQLIEEKQWGILMTHGIAAGYAALTDPEILREHFKHVKAREADVWVDTFANIARYERERDNSSLAISGKPGDFACVLSSTLDPTVYSVPLTLIIDAPDAKNVSARRAGKDLPARFEKGAVYIDAMPSPEPIRIQWR